MNTPKPDDHFRTSQTTEEHLDKDELLDSLRVIDASIEDIKAGRVRPFREAMHDIARELGLKLSDHEVKQHGSLSAKYSSDSDI